MSKYFFDYTDTVIGAAVPGLTIRGGGAPVITPAYGTPAFKKRYLNFLVNAVSIRFATVDSLDADSSRADFDLLTCFEKNATTAAGVILMGRASGTATCTSYLGIADLGGNLQIFKVVAGTFTQLIGTAFTYTAGKNYMLRFRGTGTSIQVKCWDAETAEPIFTVGVIDSSITAAGSLGIGANISTAGTVAPFNFFSVGTGGEVAQLPLTNARYTAWLSDQTARREVLAEFTATGYDSAAGTPFLKTR